jgi:hypothetical protein
MKPKYILYYANRDIENSNLYEKIEFKFIKNTNVGYWWFNKNKVMRYSRFEFSKDKLIKEGYDFFKTKNQIMKERGFYKIYNTGYLKFEKNY